ncbi:ABC transporter permease [Marivita sp. S0852]|uniref:ABC transporter permease n=1 Tax=Marivita sp. S0852 TaxID=3373893 RepID=UPI003981F7C2
MRRILGNIVWLSRKELFSVLRDWLLLVLVAYAFGPGIYVQSQSAGSTVSNASVAFVDNDRSQLSRAMHEALYDPWFQTPENIDAGRIDTAMDSDLYTFVIVLPNNMASDLRKGRQVTIQLNVDATDVMQATVGANYIRSILMSEARDFVSPGISPDLSVDLVLRRAFNPNGNGTWFEAISALLNWLTILTVILTGAALIREREHGTIGHLLVMPVTPFEIAMSKVLANAAIVFVAFTASLVFVVQGLLDVPVAGSVPLFLAGTFVYLFAAAAVGILLGTAARSMAQFALLMIITILPMMILSGGMSPVESQPQWLQYVTWFLPSRHYMSFSEAVVYRGAGLDIVWPEFVLVTTLGLAFFVMSLTLFRRAISGAGP